MIFIQLRPSNKTYWSRARDANPAPDFHRTPPSAVRSPAPYAPHRPAAPGPAGAPSRGGASWSAAPRSGRLVVVLRDVTDEQCGVEEEFVSSSDDQLNDTGEQAERYLHLGRAQLKAWK